MVVIESVVTRDLLTGEDEEASVYYVYDGEEVPDILRDSVGLNVHVDENSAMDVTAGTHSVLVTRFSAKESSKYKKSLSLVVEGSFSARSAKPTDLDAASILKEFSVRNEMLRSQLFGDARKMFKLTSTQSDESSGAAMFRKKKDDEDDASSSLGRPSSLSRGSSGETTLGAPADGACKSTDFESATFDSQTLPQRQTHFPLNPAHRGDASSRQHPSRNDEETSSSSTSSRPGGVYQPSPKRLSVEVGEVEGSSPGSNPGVGAVAGELSKPPGPSQDLNTSDPARGIDTRASERGLNVAAPKPGPPRGHFGSGISAGLSAADAKSAGGHTGASGSNNLAGLGTALRTKSTSPVIANYFVHVPPCPGHSGYSTPAPGSPRLMSPYKQPDPNHVYHMPNSGAAPLVARTSSPSTVHAPIQSTPSPPPLPLTLPPGMALVSPRSIPPNTQPFVSAGPGRFPWAHVTSPPPSHAGEHLSGSGLPPAFESPVYNRGGTTPLSDAQLAAGEAYFPEGMAGAALAVPNPSTEEDISPGARSRSTRLRTSTTEPLVGDARPNGTGSGHSGGDGESGASNTTGGGNSSGVLGEPPLMGQSAGYRPRIRSLSSETASTTLTAGPTPTDASGISSLLRDDDCALSGVSLGAEQQRGDDRSTSFSSALDSAAEMQGGGVRSDMGVDLGDRSPQGSPRGTAASGSLQGSQASSHGAVVAPGMLVGSSSPLPRPPFARISPSSSSYSDHSLQAQHASPTRHVHGHASPGGSPSRSTSPAPQPAPGHHRQRPDTHYQRSGTQPPPMHTPLQHTAPATTPATTVDLRYHQWDQIKSVLDSLQSQLADFMHTQQQVPSAVPGARYRSPSLPMSTVPLAVLPQASSLIHQTRHGPLHAAAPSAASFPGGSHGMAPIVSASKNLVASSSGQESVGEGRILQAAPATPAPPSPSTSSPPSTGTTNAHS
eukprot:Rmarinus@m.5616